MPASRRQFCTWALSATATGAVIGCGPGPRNANGPSAVAPAETAAAAPPPATTQAEPHAAKTSAQVAQQPTLLILGGTGFLGPHTVERAIERGFKVTLFNRGKTNPHLFPDLEKLRGDRDGNLEALKGRSWDAVIDTSGYVPRLVKNSAELLAPHVQHYTFISSVSVYADFAKPVIDENHPVGTMEDEGNEEVGKFYGPLKALCERAAEAAMPGRVANIRPGLIVGPGDPSDRYTYWPVRIARGGEVLAPGNGQDASQIIDARDLAAWMIHVVEERIVGVYNAVGPADKMTMQQLLQRTRKGVKSDATFTWADAAFLEEQQVAPWMHMPAWVPTVGDYLGFASTDCRKAITRGLKFRPVEDTAADTLAWHRTLPEERQNKLRAGITAERETEVLAAWHDRTRTGARRGS